MDGKIIQTGILNNGLSYRVWQRFRDGKKFVYVGKDSRRHNMNWLKKQLKNQKDSTNFEKSF